ncbi:aminomethyl transferase family protein [Bermanella marisrubri]|uniref:Putative aminomethyltransferase n=1 Tax=Bermanella marisrubri TaxID=207949 RepID=Q1N370_9GAMM|nr:aminomethyltransferase family protein [Bermanella marisrubri]EAT12721.1 putative aminomethyltransferase [Oceanobacter sp. RED65] [Bermanella marisrubri]QIZ85160.1 aminomethyl transferase family protein [Bermanella marisrubri]
MLDSIHANQAKKMVEVNGISVPYAYSDFDKEYKALRENIVLSDYSHYSKVKVEGDEAFDLLDLVVAGDVAEIRDEQTLYTVILNDEGEIITDLYVMNDDDTYILLCEHITADSLIALLEPYKEDLDDVEIEDLTKSHAMIAVEGPYSWELATEVYGMDVIGIPFHGFIALDEDTFILRAGKHGEFGYKVVLPVDQAQELWDTFEEKGEKFDLVKAGLELHETTRLENPYYNPKTVGQFSNDPRVLQLQWMVRYDKEEFAGRDALLEKREQPLDKKLVGALIQSEKAELPIMANDQVVLEGESIGVVANVGYSPSLKQLIAQVILDEAYAYAGIDAYKIKASDGSEYSIQTTATPFIQNYSMIVNPNENSYVNPDKHKNMLDQLKAKEAEAKEEAADA